MTQTMNDDALQANERLQQLIDLTHQLMIRVQFEIEAFESRQPQKVAKTISETAKFVNLYRLESARLKEHPFLVNAGLTSLKKSLIEATKQFQELLSRHARSMEAARIVTEGLVQAIAKEVASKRIQSSGYNRNARQNFVNSTAISLNQVT